MSTGLRFAFRNKKGEAWYELYRTPCPICSKEGFCLIHQDKNKVVCTREESKYSWGKDGQHHLHYLNGNEQPKIDLSSVPNYKSLEKKPANELDVVYRSFLNQLDLTDAHYQHLTGESRQFTDDEIAIRGYKSFPVGKSTKIFKDIASDAHLESTEDLLGVPGFYRYKDGDLNLVILKGMPSILIPFRNEKNEIVGMQHRVDVVQNELIISDAINGFDAKLIEQPNNVELRFNKKVIWTGEIEIGEDKPIVINQKKLGSIKIKKGMRYFWLSSQNRLDGTGAGGPLPVHVAVPTDKLKNWNTGELLSVRSAWLTEGPIKGDSCANQIKRFFEPEEIEELGDTFICIPGVNQWRLALPTIDAMGIEHINIAIDADAASNSNVYLYLKELAIELKRKGLTANLIIWNEDEGKGLDDLFLNNKIPHIKRLF